MAREKGCHVVAEYRNATLSYAEPQPIEPKDELADLLRQYLARRESEAKQDQRLERLVTQFLAPRAA